MTLERFLIWESQQEGKHEFQDGHILPRVVAMAGGFVRHDILGMNLAAALRTCLHGSGCRPYLSDQLILCEAQGNVYRPDVSLFCERPETRRYGTLEAAVNPVAVFEVLSPTTEANDRGRKLEAYTAIPSVQEVALISGNAPRIEQYVRDAEGWRWVATVGLEASVRVLGRDVPLAEIYEEVEFETDAPNPTEPPSFDS